MSGTKKGAKKRRFPPAFCLICGHSWEPRSENPRQCPKCQSRRWNKPSEEPEEPTTPPEPLPPVPRLDPRSEMERIEGQERRGRLIAAMRRMRERPRDAERKRTMISQDNPPLYELAANVLPKLPIIGILLALAFSAVTSMAAGNMWFVMDWYEATWILPQIVGIFTYAGGPGEWFADYWPVVVLAAMLLISLAIFVWALPWRVAFKDYVIVRGNTRARDGRVMWSTMNIWTRLWDRIYGTEPRKTVDIWLKTKFWWNPLIPSKGLLRLTLDREVERPEYNGIFTIEARERRYRQYVGHDHMITTDDAQQSRPIPLAHINSNFHSRGQRLVRDTQKFSLANPTVRLEKLRGGTHIVPNDLREAADVARQKRDE